MIEITVREPTQKGDYHHLRVPTYIQKGIAKKISQPEIVIICNSASSPKVL